MSKPRILVLVGPTAVGKTAAAVELGLRLNAEILSADSRQIYRHMDIGTAKPTIEQRSAAPHHFIDIVDPDEDYNAGRYGSEGRERIREILGRGKQVLVVGGSGLYVRSLIDGIFEDAGKNDAVRDRIRRDMAVQGTTALHERLKQIDSKAASRIHPNDARRIERALEVYELTGRSISELQRKRPAVDFEPVLFGLSCGRTELYRRIDERVDRMIRDGLIEETRALLNRGYSEHLISMESLGYREIAAHLRGRLTLERAVELFKQGSRNYAKRQWTWFRKDRRIRWTEVHPSGSPTGLVEDILTAYRKA